MAQKKVLIVGDSPSVPTGFSNVIKNIFKYFDPNEYTLVQLGVNFYGDPHNVGWDIFPAYPGGDVWGFGRFKQVIELVKPDVLFILNDIWVIHKYLKELSTLEHFNIPIVVYYPVDSYAFNEDWFTHFNLVSQAVVYTKFGYDVSKLVAPGVGLKIIPHGVDTENFYKINLPKEDIKKKLFPKIPEFYDNSFIVLNANRNQPRKRIDLTMKGFAEFAKDKPVNVKLYLHMGLKDVGWDVIRMAKRLGIDSKLIVSNSASGIQSVSIDRLNMIYNGTDAGINTSIGEGWGLTNMEHGVTGAPQIVPDSSACTEVYGDCSLLIPATIEQTNHDTLTEAKVVRPEDVASKLQELYTNKELYDSLAKRVRQKFSRPEYNWMNIANQWMEIINSVTNNNMA